MKILIDIGHPAHVHYFRNFIKIMQSKGHDFLLTARDKEVVFSLLDFFEIPYVSRRKGKTGVLGKLSYIPKADTIIYKCAKSFKPDLFLSFGSPYAAQASWLAGKPHIAFDDTDHAFFEHLFYPPFTKTILTPQRYLKDFGNKHIRFDSWMELTSLHRNYFKPDPSFLKTQNINPDIPFAVIRLVSWKASHDIGQSGISNTTINKLVKQLSEKGNVIISSESELPAELKQYQFRLHPALIHQLLFHASLFISESLTMSAEAAFLGTPAICKSSAVAGVTIEQTSLGLYEKISDEEILLERAGTIFSDKNCKSLTAEKNKQITDKKIDVTAFMVWFIENYPKSIITMKQNPDYQYNFR